MVTRLDILRRDRYRCMHLDRLGGRSCPSPARLITGWRTAAGPHAVCPAHHPGPAPADTAPVQ